jgi:hypothetical protein
MGRRNAQAAFFFFQKVIDLGDQLDQLLGILLDSRLGAEFHPAFLLFTFHEWKNPPVEVRDHSASSTIDLVRRKTLIYAKLRHYPRCQRPLGNTIASLIRSPRKNRKPPRPTCGGFSLRGATWRIHRLEQVVIITQTALPPMAGCAT